MRGIELQKIIFTQIQALYQNKAEMIRDLSQLLSISENAVYKRLKGATGINLDDLVTLTKHYRIPLDAHLLTELAWIGFSYPPVRHSPKSYAEYLAPMLELARLGQQLSPLEINLYYATNEFPFFHYFYFDRLNHFKYFVWAWTSWELEALQHKKITLEQAPIKDDPYTESTREIATLFHRIHGHEFISVTAMHNTIEQIKYFLQIDKFEKRSDALLLCETLREMIQHLEHMARLGKKFRPGQLPDEQAPDYYLYYNEMIQTNNVAIYQTPVGNWLFSTLDNPNVLSTQDERLHGHLIQWFDKLRKRSFVLSTGNEKQRITFFRQLYQQLDKATEEIKFLVG